jgi:polo-like kinase 1
MDTANGTTQEIIEERFVNGFGETMVRRYLKGKCLGKGGFAQVFEVTNVESKRVMAAKIISKESLKKSRQRQKLMSEIKIHKALRHPNIVHYEHVFEDHANVYMLMELCRNESLNELMKRRKRLTEFETRSYTAQLTKGLIYIHSQDIIHRDLKLGNLFLSDKMEIKIGDFGLAAKLLDRSERRTTVCGTPNYIAPEILAQSGHSFEVDLWSLGVVIYTLLLGKPPFETNEIKATYKLIKNCKFSFPEDMTLSTNARDMISRLIRLDPAKRIALDELITHPFLTVGGPLPDFLPLSTLACPPSSSYLRQFLGTHSVKTISEEIPEFDQHRIGSIPLIPAKIATSHPLENPKDGKMAIDDAKFLKLQTSGELNKRFVVEDESAFTSWELKSSSIRGLQQVKSGDIIHNKDSNKNKDSSVGTLFDSQVHVVKYLDYSAKYGFGYAMSDGGIGVHFNDKSSLFRPHDSRVLYYIEKAKDKSVDKKWRVSTFQATEYPFSLKKKYQLFHYITNELLHCEQEFTLKESSISEPLSSHACQNLEGEAFVIGKYFLKTKHALIVKTNARLVQILFIDNAEIWLDCRSETIGFISPKGEMLTASVGTAIDQKSYEFRKHLKYVQQLFKQMIAK